MKLLIIFVHELVYVVYNILDQSGSIFARSLDIGLYHIVGIKSIIVDISGIFLVAFGTRVKPFASPTISKFSLIIEGILFISECYTRLCY